MTAYYNEFDPKAAAWLRELMKAGLIADGVVDERSILEVEADDLREFTQCHFFAGIGGWSYALRLAGVPDDMEVWTGSPPCQPFSTAGLQKGKDDARHLAPKFASLVRTARPALLFGEQVASAAVFGPSPKGNRPGFEGTPPWAWLDDLSDRLEAARYAVWANDVPAAGVGGPHIRQRTFFGALRLDHSGGLGWLGRGPSVESGRAALAATERSGDADRMADASSARPLPGPLGGVHRVQEGARPRNAEPERHGSASRVADADGRDTRAEREQPGGQQRQQPQDGGVGRLADASGEHLRGGLGPRDGATSQAEGAARQRERSGADAGGCLTDGRPGPVIGVWRDADWLYCRDGKWRPVEAGTFPLAARVPNRVGLLRGYGNAIVPEAAQAFIEASLEALDDVQRLRLMSDLAGDVFG